MTLKIIGAGFGRTGTKSLKLGLEQLGLGPCDHMTEVAEDPRRAGDWIDALAGEPVDWDAVFDGDQSTVDWPACRFWRELSEFFGVEVPNVNSTEEFRAQFLGRTGGEGG